jgi:hypothetical protein
MVLTAIAASRVQEDDLLVSFARLLVEDLTLSPKGRCDIDVATDDAVFVQFLLLILGSGASEGVVQEFQDATPDVGPASERVLQWLDILVDLHLRVITSP